MRILMQFTIPHEPFNTYVREGIAGEKIGRVIEALNPEAAYFSEFDGHRGGIFIVNVRNSSDVPALSEPLFLTFNADVRLQVCMTPDDLGKSGLDRMGEDWS